MPRKRLHHKNLPQRMTFSHGKYYYRAKDGKWINLGAKLTHALIKYSQHIETNNNIQTLKHIIDRYLIEISPTLREKTYENEILHAKKLISAFGHAKPHQLQPSLIYQYLDIRGKTSLHSANKEVALLSKILDHAIRWGVCEHNPAKHIKKHKLVYGAKKLPLDVFTKLCSLDDYMAEIMLFGRITSLRQGDIIRIKTEDIIEEGINYFINKTQEEAFIPFTEKLKACVSRLLKMRHNPKALYPTLICTLEGKPYSDYGFKSKWRRINDKALQLGYISERVKFRNIRSMAANLAFEQGGIKRAQELLGHNDSKTTTKHYLLKQKKIIVPLE